MGKFQDLTGMVFGKLTVIKRADDYVSKRGYRRARWLCECSCSDHSKTTVFEQDLLKNNGTRSCGCLARERTTESNKKYNKYQLNLQDDNGTYGVGYCSNTGREFYFDMDDYDKIKDYCWHEHIINNTYYALEAYERKTKQMIRMNWLIVGKNYDHSDRNPMNNRKYNLREATSQENARNHSKQRNNTSGFTGVSWHSTKMVWVASIIINKKKIHLCSSVNKEDAIKARLEAEAKYFGEFAPQRHLFEEYDIIYPKS